MRNDIELLAIFPAHAIVIVAMVLQTESIRLDEEYTYKYSVPGAP